MFIAPVAYNATGVLFCWAPRVDCFLISEVLSPLAALRRGGDHSRPIVGRGRGHPTSARRLTGRRTTQFLPDAALSSPCPANQNKFGRGNAMRTSGLAGCGADAGRTGALELVPADCTAAYGGNEGLEDHVVHELTVEELLQEEPR